MNPDILILNNRSGKFFREIKKLKFKKVIAHPHFVSFTSRAFSTPFPYFRAKKYMTDIVLKLVRVINPKLYDENFHKIDFAKMKDFLPQDSRFVVNLFKSIDMGNVHLCNILQIPSLVFIDKIAKYRFGGGESHICSRIWLAKRL